jgi:hypothetical protein
MQFNKDNIEYDFLHSSYPEDNELNITFFNYLCEFNIELSNEDEFIDTFNDIIPKMEKLEEFEIDIQHGGELDIIKITFELEDDKFYIGISSQTWNCNIFGIKLLCNIKDMIEIFKDIIDKYNNMNE